jgi:hypothetical protein
MGSIESRSNIIGKLGTAGAKTCPAHGVPDGGKLEKPAAGKSWQTYSYQVRTCFAPCDSALTLPAAPNVTALWRCILKQRACTRRILGLGVLK